ncbi:MAG: alpha-E domain-containing protein [Lachnospiraceae bacterium]|nr:alpha-E domain-containing protein [Lachnospiraceae bacterium]
MGIISLEQADRLYWLGRYTERVYTTLNIFEKSFDELIDGIADSYDEFCKSIDIPNIYESKADFVKQYPFDPANTDSIISNLNRAYDNAIVLRESIGSEALSFIQLALYEMNRAASSKAPVIELQKVNDNLLAFYGTVDDQIDSENIRNIIKAGKRIERIDIYARLGSTQKQLKREVNRMIPRVEKSGLKYDTQKLDTIKELVSADTIDYYKVVNEVEAIF